VEKENSFGVKSLILMTKPDGNHLSLVGEVVITSFNTTIIFQKTGK
jgi:hypothetical protein